MRIHIHSPPALLCNHIAVDITLDLLKAAVIKLAELTGENRFILFGRATLAITAPAPFQEFARSDDIDLWPEGSEDAALDLCIQPMGEGSPFYCGEER